MYLTKQYYWYLSYTTPATTTYRKVLDGLYHTLYPALQPLLPHTQRIHKRERPPNSSCHAGRARGENTIHCRRINTVMPSRTGWKVERMIAFNSCRRIWSCVKSPSAAAVAYLCSSSAFVTFQSGPVPTTTFKSRAACVWETLFVTSPVSVTADQSLTSKRVSNIHSSSKTSFL